MVILKALKSSDFFFFMLLLYLPILNSCNPVLAHHHNYSLLKVCLLAALNLNTSLKRQHRMKSLAKPHWLHREWDQLEEQGSLERHESLSFPSCWVCENEDEILFEGPSTCVSRDMPLLSCFARSQEKFLYYLQVTNWRGWMSHWRQFWAGLACRLPVSGKVHPILPFLLHSHSQNNMAVLNIAMPCSFNKRRFLQGAQATTFVKISTSIWDVVLA